MIKFEKIKPGMELWEVKRNTGGILSGSSSKWITWPVFVELVDTEKRRVLASWNYNAPRWMNEREVCKFRAKRPKED